MNSFGDALKKARIAKRYTLREVSKDVGKSIGYLSDIEHNRKQPPELETVSKIEQFLDINEGFLVNMANKIRKNIKATKLNWRKKLETDQRLATILCRSENLSDDDKDRLIKTLEEMEEE